MHKKHWEQNKNYHLKKLPCYPALNKCDLKQNKTKTKKRVHFYIHKQGQKNHLKVNFIIVGTFYFSANTRKVGNTHHMSEESNTVIESCPSLWFCCASIIMIIHGEANKKIFKRNKEAYCEGSAWDLNHLLLQEIVN